MVQTYNVFDVVTDNKGNVISKKPAKRETVRISEQTANTNNEYTHSTKKLYELAEEKPDRAALFIEAEALGLEVPKNIKTEQLINKIKEAKE